MWFQPRSPLDIREKAWVEDAMLLVAGQCGLGPMTASVVVVPDREFYSANGQYQGTSDEAGRILETLCGVVGVDEGSVQLEIVADEAVGPAAGYERGKVQVPKSVVGTPDRLAAMLAHRVAGERVLSMGKAVANENVARVSSIVAIYFGLGVLLTDASISEKHHTSISVPGSLPSRMLGYSMALYAWVRGEPDPVWKRRLRPDALATFSSGLHYLKKTRDSLFNPISAAAPRENASARELLRQLQTGSPSARIAALWQLRDPRFAAEAADGVIAGLDHRNATIRAESAATLADFGDGASAAVPRLIELLNDRNDDVRAQCARALGGIGQNSEPVITELAEQLADSQRQVVMMSARALGRFGADAQGAAKRLLDALKIAVIRCDHPLIDELTRTLFLLSPEPLDAVADYFATESDPELRDQVVLMISESRRTHAQRASEESGG